MTPLKVIPPKTPSRLLLWFLREDLAEDVQGDLEEQFHDNLEKYSPFRARIKYWVQVLNYLRPFALRNFWSIYSISNNTDMFRHNFTISLRNIKRRRTYSALNIIGLALGIACTIIIFLFVSYHLSYDTFHKNKNRIYRVVTEIHQSEINYNQGVPSPFGEAFRNDFTYAEKVCRVATFKDQLIYIPAANETNKFEEDIAFAEPSYFEIFHFPLLRGNKQSVLKNLGSAIITEKLAKKYFGDEDPIGKVINIENKLDVKITGILQDIPDNTDRQQGIYLPFRDLKEFSPWLVEKDWWLSVNKAMQCFVLLKRGIAISTVNESLKKISDKYYNETNAKIFHFKLQPLSDIHFNANFGGYIEKKNLFVLSIIGFILIIASCVNFINLATAQASNRSKEIGVRKALGSIRGQLFWQFITETSIISISAIILGIILTFMLLPFVNQQIGANLSMRFSNDYRLISFLFTLLLLIIFISGTYPGFILSRIKPIQALKSRLVQRNLTSLTLRQGLVIVQFTIAQLLIIGTIVIAQQMKYTSNANLGFQKKAIVMISIPENNYLQLNSIRNEFSRLSSVENVTFCNSAPASEIAPSTGIQYGSRTETEKFGIILKNGDNNYVKTFGLNLIAGRNLNPSDTMKEFLFNETAVKKLGVESIQNVIGQTAVINGKSGIIVGVVKDFHDKSLHETIDPVCITTQRDQYKSCAVKINLASVNSTLKSLNNVWDRIYPNYIYKYEFLDDRIAKFYTSDRMIFYLIQLFSGIAIIICCLGVFGLISFITSQKTKEVGIRKILGAGISNILYIFNKELIKLILIAFIVSAFLATWIMDNWLENFAYRINIGISVFLLTLFIMSIITLLTVGYKSLNAAYVNPINSLRSE